MGLTRIRAEQVANSDFKQACRTITTANIANFSGGAPLVIDGVTLLNGNRVIVNAQSDATENGLYKVNTAGIGSNGTWSRTSDANENGELESGMQVMVTEGTLYGDTEWTLTTDGTIDIGTTALTFERLAKVDSISGHVIQNAGSTLATRTNLNFDGTHLVATDDSGNDQTDVTVSTNLQGWSALTTTQMLRSDEPDSGITLELLGGQTFDPTGGGTGTDTATDVAVAFPSGNRIVGTNDGYIRTLLEWNSGGNIEIGQSSTALINGVALRPGSSGKVYADSNFIARSSLGIVSTPKTVSADVTLEDNTNSMVIDNLTIADGISVTIQTVQH